MQQVTIWYKCTEQVVLIPRSIESAYQAANDTILLDEKSLYYWQYGELITDETLQFNWSICHWAYQNWQLKKWKWFSWFESYEVSIWKS